MPIQPFNPKDFEKDEAEQIRKNLLRENKLIKHSPEYIRKKQEEYARHKRIQRAEKKSEEINKRGELFLKHRKNFQRLFEIEQSLLLGNEWFGQVAIDANKEYDQICEELEQDGIKYIIQFFSYHLKYLSELMRQMRLNPKIHNELMGFDPINSDEGFRLTEEVIVRINKSLEKIERYNLSK